jgi:hypothetical protein
MATRTIKFYGNVYGSSDVTVRMNFNNVEVHNAAITPDAASLPEAPGTPTTEHALFTFDLDTSVSGDVPTSVTVTGGTVVFAYLADDDGALSTTIPTKVNVSSDDTADPEAAGEWWYAINDGETFTCDYKVDAVTA